VFLVTKQKQNTVEVFKIKLGKVEYPLVFTNGVFLRYQRQTGQRVQVLWDELDTGVVDYDNMSLLIALGVEVAQSLISDEDVARPRWLKEEGMAELSHLKVADLIVPNTMGGVMDVLRAFVMPVQEEPAEPEKNAERLPATASATGSELPTSPTPQE